MNSTQLTDFRNYDIKRLIFSKPEVGNIPGAISKLTFKRIRLATKNPDGTIGDLVLATPPNLMCYGLQEQTDPSNGVVNGYQFPMVLWNRNEPSQDEKTFTDVITKITEACKDHLLSHKEEIEKYDLEPNDLKKFSPLYYKMEKGKIVDGKSPMFYIKTMTSKKTEGIKIHTVFTNEDTNDLIDPMDLMNKRCYVQGAIKIESIFVGNKISLQVKLFEARVKLIDTAFRSLLNPNVVLRTEDVKPKEEEKEIPILAIKPQGGFTETGSLKDEDEEDDDDEEDEEDEDEEETPAPAPVVVSKSVEEEKPKTAAKRAPAARKK